MSSITVGYSSTELQSSFWPLEAIQASSVTLTQNDFGLDNMASVLVLSGAAPVFTGIDNGRTGRILHIVYSGSGTLTFNHEDTNSAAENRIVSPTASAFSIIPTGRISLIYDGTRWQHYALAGSGAGITQLNAANISTGQVPLARLGTGTPDSTKVLYGDGTWQAINAAAFGAGMQGSVSFGSTETSHTSSIDSLDLSSVDECLLIVHGPWQIIDNLGRLWAISARVTSTSTVTFYRTDIQGNNTSDLPASTHYFSAFKVNF